MDVPSILCWLGIFILLVHGLTGLTRRLPVPDALLWVGVGMGLNPLLGRELLPYWNGMVPWFTAMALAVILFSLGVLFPLEFFQQPSRKMLRFSFISFLGTAGVISILVHYLTRLDWEHALMLGTMLGGAVKREGMSNQLFSLLATLVLLERSVVGDLWLVLFQAVTLGVLASGLTWIVMTKKIISEKPTAFIILALVFILYGGVEMLGLSGGIAVFTFAIVGRLLACFHESMIEEWLWHEGKLLLKAFFLLWVGLSISLSDYWTLLFGLWLSMVILFIRIPIIALFLPQDFSVEEASHLAVFMPRGFAVAVLAGLLLDDHLVNIFLMQQVVYAVILFSGILTACFVFLIKQTAVREAYAGLFAKFESHSSS